jgi:hypothetical protein
MLLLSPTLFLSGINFSIERISIDIQYFIILLPDSCFLIGIIITVHNRAVGSE